jgi:hypothetical protein
MNVRRFFTTSTIICALFCVLLIIYGRPVGLLLYTKWKLRNESKLWIVPTPLPVATAGLSPGRSFSYFGYEFESPWSEVKRESKLESMTILNFSNGDMITILDPKKHLVPLREMKQVGSQHGADIGNIFGDEATHTNYAFRSKILHLTPADLRLSFSRREMVSNSVLLMLKPIWANENTLYSFKTEWFRGFQNGDPAQAKAVVIEAFDPQDQEVELWIGAAQAASYKPSQGDINRILYSLHPVSAFQSK